MKIEKNIYTKKVAFITGIRGQDGSYLAQLLLKNNYSVIGLIRKDGSTNKNLDHLNITEKTVLVECDLLDFSKIKSLIKKYNPNEIYNLAAQSSVGKSFSSPYETINFNTISVLNILENIRVSNPAIKFYQASSSEMYGKINALPITEDSILDPISPYAISKTSSFLTCKNYRESYNLFISSGILFNHESILRGNNFIIKKIITNSVKIKNGTIKELEVGNINIKRDFGYAPEYVNAMYLMMQHNSPNDYIICSEKSISLKEIIYYVFKKLGINTNKIIINKDLYRPQEIKDIYGDSSKARKILKWNYNTDFFTVLDELIQKELK